PELRLRAPVLKVLEPNFADNVSVDQDLAVRWSVDLKGSGYTRASVLGAGNRVYTASNGHLFEVDALTGRVRNSLLVTGDLAELGSYETRLAIAGNLVFAGVHGRVYAVPVGGGRFDSVWKTTLPGANGTVVEVLAVHGRVFAGAHGYLYEIDPHDGAVLRSVQLGSRFGQGDYTMRLAVAGPTLVAGTHGRVYGIALADFSTAWELGLPDAGYQRVDVLAGAGRLFAASNGLAYRIDPATGALRNQLRVAGLLGTGDYTTSLAANARQLFVGTHGHVYAIDLTDWAQPAWTAELAGDRHSLPSLVATDDQLLAGSYGHVFRIDPATGVVQRSTMVTPGVGVGDYETRLAFDTAADEVYAGTHGYAYKLASVSV
ncbi:PQQ-binding-like beta-propeller repeat protein, partial [Jatrophihabitans sp.]|uniref:outer membrane protein assembly factor BamB family protein n=1 Tax=Jatrophihabitans sp. TaxID=1932789 RepID=UPI002B64BC42|nr:PQQ-binding-like beta-propeller repeat protein [Jatrophihabitans sp.]